MVKTLALTVAEGSMRRSVNLNSLTALSWCVALNLYAVSVGADDLHPTKPIHLIVTTAAGGAGDLVARAFAERLSESMRQPVIIENQLRVLDSWTKSS